MKWIKWWKVALKHDIGSFYHTSSFLLRSRKCRATCKGRMLCNRHSLCSLSSLISSTSCWAWRRHRKSSRAVASHFRREVKHCSSVELPMDSEQRGKRGFVCGNGGRCSCVNYLPAIVVDGNDEHGHEKNGNSFSSSVVSPVMAEGKKHLFQWIYKKNWTRTCIKNIYLCN